MKSVIFKLTGTNGLMLNNSQTVNPFNKYTLALKPLTAKRKKTDDDYNEIYRLQFESSLYTKDGVYILPSDHFWKSICTAAREQKLGKKFEQSLQVVEDAVLDFPEKGMSPDELYKDGSHVDVRDGVVTGNKRITVCRAIFNEWSATFTVWFDETQIDQKDLERIVEIAGQRYGVGTYRKKYGRFHAEIQ